MNIWSLWEEKLVAYWVDEIPHIRNGTISHLEGMHKILKNHIKISVGDMNCFRSTGRVLVEPERQHKSQADETPAVKKGGST